MLNVGLMSSHSLVPFTSSTSKNQLKVSGSGLAPMSPDSQSEYGSAYMSPPDSQSWLCRWNSLNSGRGTSSQGAERVTENESSQVPSSSYRLATISMLQEYGLTAKAIVSNVVSSSAGNVDDSLISSDPSTLIWYESVKRSLPRSQSSVELPTDTKKEKFGESGLVLDPIDPFVEFNG